MALLTTNSLPVTLRMCVCVCYTPTYFHECSYCSQQLPEWPIFNVALLTTNSLQVTKNVWGLSVTRNCSGVLATAVHCIMPLHASYCHEFG